MAQKIVSLAILSISMARDRVPAGDLHLVVPKLEKFASMVPCFMASATSYRLWSLAHVA